MDSYVDDLSPSPPKPPHPSFLSRTDSRDSYGSGSAAQNSSVLTEKLRKLRKDNNVRLHREKSLYRMASLQQMQVPQLQQQSSSSIVVDGIASPNAGEPLSKGVSISCVSFDEGDLSDEDLELEEF